MSKTVTFIITGIIVGLVSAGLMALNLLENVQPFIKFVVTVGVVVTAATIGLLFWFDAIAKRLAIFGCLMCMSSAGFLIGQMCLSGFEISGSLEKKKTATVSEENQDAQTQEEVSETSESVGGEGKVGEQYTWQQLAVFGVVALTFVYFALRFLESVARANGEPNIANGINKMTDNVKPPAVVAVLLVGYFVAELEIGFLPKTPTEDQKPTPNQNSPVQPDG